MATSYLWYACVLIYQVETNAFEKSAKTLKQLSIMPLPIGLAAAAPAAMNLAGNMFNISEAKKGRKQARAAARRQFERQQKLNKQGYNLAMKMWKNTNYEAQMEQMRKAGLNTGLMYGMGGGHGATSNTGSGGSAGMQATTQNPYMDIGNSLDALMMKSQIDVNEATAKKLEAEAEKTSGVDTQKTSTEIESLSQGINNQKAQEQLVNIQSQLTDIQRQIAQEGKEFSLRQMEWEAEKTANDATIALLQANLDNATLDTKIKILSGELANLNTENQLKQAQTKLTNEQALKLKEDIAQGWEQIAINSRNADSQEVANMIRDYEAKVKEKYPNMSQVIGYSFQTLRGVIDGIKKAYEQAGRKKVGTMKRDDQGKPYFVPEH